MSVESEGLYYTTFKEALAVLYSVSKHLGSGYSIQEVPTLLPLTSFL